MIGKIELHDCIPYTQAELSECKKINFIYGANGSGKSTIGSLLSGEYDSRFSNSSIEWTDVSHETIYVYNRQFRNRNFQQTIPGVFTLGSATIDDINLLEEKKKTLEHEKEEYGKNNEVLRKKTQVEIPACEKKFRDDVWEIVLKTNEADFQRAFEGLRNNKEKFVTELKKRIDGIPGHEGKICPRNELITRANTLFRGTVKSCENIVLNIHPWLDELERIRLDPIWNSVIVGNSDVDIASLINELGNSSWVSKGRSYLRPDSKKCPFCQQETITDAFRETLKSFFYGKYQSSIDKMTQYMDRYVILTNNITECINDVLNNENAVTIGEIQTDSFISKNDKLANLFSNQIESIKQKIDEPSMKVSLPDILPSIREIEEIISDANAKIAQHNMLVDKQETEEENLKDDIWATVINDANSLIKLYQTQMSDLTKAVRGLNSAVEKRKTEIDRLEKEIIEKGKNITSVQPSIDEINRLLVAYGFTNFSIQPSEEQENHYCIKREDGTLASGSLSEGEETFLSFLYFMQQTKGATDPDHVSDKKIIVLDDPICSLDSTILYIVGAMVKELSRDIRNGIGDVNQLFVLTHNVFFHKEASYIDGQTKELSEVNYWIVRKDGGVSTISPYGMKNPISTSYELLWQELRDNENLTRVTIQNTMRRIIENYFGMLGNRKNERLIDCFSNAEDKMIARSLIAWINDGSHSIPDDLYIDSYTDAVPKYKDVFKRIFFNSDNAAHYNMMMRIENDAETKE